MRKLILPLLLVASGAIGLAGSAPAEAQDRVYVRSGDVVFSYGRPYWRLDRSQPLYVVYDRGYPRYYRYSGPGYYPGYVRDYSPRWRDRRWHGPRHDYGYERRWRRDRGWDRDVVIEYRDWD